MFYVTMSVFKFCQPFHMIVSSMSMGGKTYFVLKLLRHLDFLLEKTPSQIIYYYKNYNSEFESEDLKHVKFIATLPVSADEIPTDSLLVFDDQMTS